MTHAFAQSFLLGGRNLAITASVGVSVGEAGHCSADTLLRNADMALFRAKAEGKGRTVLFDLSMDNNGVAELELEAELRRALERGELRVHYQPIVELGTGRLLEVEALARWNHPTRGLLSPADFIPLAEATGLIIPLGRQVLMQGSSGSPCSTPRSSPSCGEPAWSPPAPSLRSPRAWSWATSSARSRSWRS